MSLDIPRISLFSSYAVGPFGNLCWSFEILLGAMNLVLLIWSVESGEQWGVTSVEN